MKKITKWMALTLLALFFVNGAIAQKKLTQKINHAIHLQSEPAGAQVYLNGKLICPETPGTASFQCEVTMYYNKKKEDAAYVKRAEEENTYTLTFVKDGYITGEEVLKPTISFQRFPMVSPVLYASYPYSLLHIFTAAPQSNHSSDTSIPHGEASKAVHRDNPGQTALERTIIRWYFESEPQGARIYWRVISSVPDQVKNTNELWLGNTPFEETRSFNIQGLTYENSRDVQIEIKVRRNGYIDQTKRFNARQAIDQQEISSFFDMVKKEE